MSTPPPSGPKITAKKALQRLIDGNERFLRGEARFPTVQKEILVQMARQQRPYATILGCSDSRVPPELLFDAGFGELFVIRVAGNIITPEVAGSLQYAGVHLKTPLFIVLGHKGCGAVDAALQAKFKGVQHRSRIAALVENIFPALDGIDPKIPLEEQMALAVEANVRLSMRLILQSPEGAARIAEGKMMLVGAVYEIETGRVTILR